MPFQLKPDKSVEKNVRRLAGTQIDKALVGLTGRDGAGLEEVVHDARKRFKRVRALIRLAEDGLGRKLAEREDVRFRDAGRPLSEVRDAGVLVQALDDLLDRFGDQGRPEAFKMAREALLCRKREITRRVLGEEDSMAKVARALEQARGNLKRWAIAGDEWGAFESGLSRIYRRGRKAFQEALKAPTDERLHEWRKRVKDLWYVMEILKPIRPRYTEVRGEEAHKLADALGDDHDLAVLRQAISAPEETPCDCASADVIPPLIDRRRAELQRDAFAIGPRLLGDPPSKFISRLRAYWRAWRSEVEAARFE